MRLITIIIISTIIIVLGIVTYFHSYNMVTSQQQTNETINPENLTTLDRMRFTAIQMTILDLETATPTNISNDQIASEIYKYQQENTTDRLTTFEIEDLYRNITNGTQTITQ